jgi:hypothetical protein
MIGGKRRQSVEKTVRTWGQPKEVALGKEVEGGARPGLPPVWRS